MPDPRKNHEYRRANVCFLCLEKNSDGILIREDYKTFIAKEIYPDFFKDEKFLPKGLCSGCRRIMNSQNSTSPRKCPGKIVINIEITVKSWSEKRYFQ